MKAEAAQRAALLLAEQRVAALGTLHAGAPNVTMVPFAVSRDPFGLLVLVSGLAAHTRDMREEPRVGLMVAEPEVPGAPVHALARVSLQATAIAIAPEAEAHVAARATYLARFPDMAGLFALADFALFRLEPHAARVVTGFAQAASITPEALAAAVRAS